MEVYDWCVCYCFDMVDVVWWLWCVFVDDDLFVFVDELQGDCVGVVN